MWYRFDPLNNSVPQPLPDASIFRLEELGITILTIPSLKALELED
jgi:hypothetical protein